MSDYHWLLHCDVMQYAHPRIVVVTNDGKPSKVATVDNERAVRQMLRYAQLGQDIEALCDENFDLSVTNADGQRNFVIQAMYLVRACIAETSGSNLKGPDVPEFKTGG